MIGRPGGNGNLMLGGKAGNIISPNPQGLGSTQVYYQQGYINGQLVRNHTTLQTQTVELLTHHDNLIMLTRDVGRTFVVDNVFQRMLQASMRSVEDPTGSLGQARTEVINKNTGSSSYVYHNLILGSNRRFQALTLDHPYWDPYIPEAPPEIVLPSPLSKDQAFTTLNTLTILNDGNVSTQYLHGREIDESATISNVWWVGRNSNGLGGGRLSLISNGSLINQNLLGTTGVTSGGSINIATFGNINNTVGGMIIAGNLFTPKSTLLHGGSIILKTQYGDISHGWDVQSYDQAVTRANGKLMGGTIRMKAGQDFLYGGWLGFDDISAQGGLQGGIIKIKAAHDIPTPAGGLLQGLLADGLSPIQGRGGYIILHANNKNHFPHELTSVTGGLVNGTTRITEGN